MNVSSGRKGKRNTMNKYMFIIGPLLAITGVSLYGSQEVQENIETRYQQMLTDLGKNKKCIVKWPEDTNHSPLAESKHNKTYFNKALLTKNVQTQNKVLAHEAYHVAHNHYVKRVLLEWGSILCAVGASIKLIARPSGKPTLFALGSSLSTMFWGQIPLTKYQEYRAQQYAQSYVRKKYFTNS